MTEIELLKQQIKTLQSKLEFLEEIEKHNAKPKMHLENEGEFGIVTYDGYVYYRLEYPTAVIWYKRKGDIGGIRLVRIPDLETYRLLEDKWNNEVITQKDTEPECLDEPEENEWKLAALRFGEKLSDIGPGGYYNFTAGEWVEWALNAYEKDTEPYCPDEPEYYDEVEWDEKDNPNIQKVIDKMVEERKSQKLYNMVRNELGYSFDLTDEIVDLVERWLPEPQSAAGSQNAYVECSVEGFNDCLTKIKSKLR